jgi:hypothetical protein
MSNLHYQSLPGQKTLHRSQGSNRSRENRARHRDTQEENCHEPSGSFPRQTPVISGLQHGRDDAPQQAGAIPMSVSDINLTGNSGGPARNAVHGNDAKFYVWPVVGIAFAFLCTVLWCAFLVWVLV